MEEKERKEAAKKTTETEESHEEHHKKKKKDEIIEELEKTLAAKDQTIKALQEKMLYMQADFENLKRIKEKEKSDLLKFGNELLIKEFLPVLDNLERALEHAATAEDLKSITDGVNLTVNEFRKVLDRAGVTAVDAVGKAFDPNFHEAFYQEEREDLEPGTILSEFQKGYLLNGRLIRPSKGILSKKGEEQ
jgi:molecular chaperone GrpE